MKLNYKSDNVGLNRLFEPLNGYHEWSPEEVMEYLIFIDDIDFEVADNMLEFYQVEHDYKSYIG